MIVRSRGRGNIGDVAAGISKDLKLVGFKYNIAVAIFYVGGLLLVSCDLLTTILLDTLFSGCCTTVGTSLGDVHEQP